jgi:hypothetical protein
MEKAPIVISFGAPRSGTTLMQKWLSNGVGFIGRKLQEGNRLHPCNSQSGLYDLQHLCGPDTVFVRIYRDPLEIYRSFYVAQYVLATGHEDAKGKCGMAGLASASDGKIAAFIRDEDFSTSFQQKLKVGKHAITVVAIDYCKLSNPDYRKRIIGRLASHLPQSDKNTKLLSKWMDDKFGVEAVREGALSHGLVGDKLPPVVQERLDRIKEVIRFVGNRPDFNTTDL